MCLPLFRGIMTKVPHIGIDSVQTGIFLAETIDSAQIRINSKLSKQDIKVIKLDAL
jgi:hypothetical protein